MNPHADRDRSEEPTRDEMTVDEAHVRYDKDALAERTPEGTIHRESGLFDVRWKIEPEVKWEREPAVQALHDDFIDAADRMANARHNCVERDATILRLRAEVERLQQWKAEALPVISGLQELGHALGVRLGASITGESAHAAARDLRSRAEKAEAALARVEALADALETCAKVTEGGDDWYGSRLLRSTRSDLLRALRGDGA